MIASACVKFVAADININCPNNIFEIPCHRHADAYYIIAQFLRPNEIDKTKTKEGFLDHNGKFLDRYEAMDEAIRCGQVDKNKVEVKLFSEDLW